MFASSPFNLRGTDDGAVHRVDLVEPQFGSCEPPLLKSFRPSSAIRPLGRLVVARCRQKRVTGQGKVNGVAAGQEESAEHEQQHNNLDSHTWSLFASLILPAGKAQIFTAPFHGAKDDPNITAARRLRSSEPSVG
jgi:hypothetical protein